MKILIVRDRESAGGGIYNYYRNVTPYLTSEIRLQDVGKPHQFFGKSGEFWGRFSSLRLLGDCLALLVKIVVFRPDIVHVNPGLDASSRRALRREAVNVLLSHWCGCKVVVFWRGWEAGWVGNPSFPGGSEGWLYRAYQRAAAHIVLASPFMEDLKNWGFRMPIHLETTVAGQDCIEAGQSGLASLEDPNLLFLSRVDEAKGVFELLEAYRILKARGHTCRLTIAGDGPCLKELKARAVEMGLEGVEFPGYVTGPEKVECYRKGSIFCFPSSHGEGMPNAVLEAMALGLPVVSSVVGGLQDIVEEGRTGFVVPLLADGVAQRMCDPEALANVIEKLLKDSELCKRMSRHNRDYARERFAAPKVAQRLDAIYASVLGQEGETVEAEGSAGERARES